MTRKHFIALASALAEIRPNSLTQRDAYAQWSETVNRVASVCSQTNPRFDRSVFIAACNGGNNAN